MIEDLTNRKSEWYGVKKKKKTENNLSDTSVEKSPFSLLELLGVTVRDSYDLGVGTTPVMSSFNLLFYFVTDKT